MANPTTNFGWQMPQNTDLVKDLPADFEVFGQAVDTDLADLKGGTTGQVLSKTTNTDLDFTWITPADQTPLTTKGDLFTFSTVDARLPVGSDGQYLVADSAETTGLKWAAFAGGGKLLQIIQDTLDSNYTTTSGTYNDTGLTVTITPSSATSKVLILSYARVSIFATTTLTSNYGSFQLLRGATTLQEQSVGDGAMASVNSPEFYINQSFVILDSPATTSATTYKIQGKQGSAGSSVRITGSATSINTIIALEIGA